MSDAGCEEEAGAACQQDRVSIWGSFATSSAHFLGPASQPRDSRQRSGVLQVGRGVVRRQGSDVALMGYGTAVNECLAAADILAKSGIKATVADMR